VARTPAGELTRCHACRAQIIYKIDIPANRYDMLCVEVRATRHAIGLRQADPRCRALLGRSTSFEACSPRPHTRWWSPPAARASEWCAALRAVRDLHA
jgi:hypothetical protein